ncbi:hypothetical protein C8R45DRAFT_1211272 [Mycena sanguinolenta]|nr:hypothetical protein C8R45DRAFT_1211272 [Mycena sanguinolenta]
MFSKLLALGLSAPAVVRAAPAPLSRLSCSPAVSTSTWCLEMFPSFATKDADDLQSAPVKSLAAGQYMIYNEGFEQRPLRVFAPDQAVWVGPEVPGNFARWSIAQSGSNEYPIRNIGSYTGTKVKEGKVVSTTGQGDSFIISPAGDGEFTIQVPNQDAVWTVIPEGQASYVYLAHQRGGSESKWRIVRAA